MKVPNQDDNEVRFQLTEAQGTLILHQLSMPLWIRFPFHELYCKFLCEMENLHEVHEVSWQTCVIKLWAPLRPSSSPVLKRKMIPFLNPWAHWDIPRASSNITPTHELQSPAPSLKMITCIRTMFENHIEKKQIMWSFLYLWQHIHHATHKTSQQCGTTSS